MRRIATTITRPYRALASVNVSRVLPARMMAAPAAAVSAVSAAAPTPVKKNKVHVLVGADGTRRYAFERGIPFADVSTHIPHA